MPFIRLVLTIIFIAWLLPLGIFIKQSNQKAFCGGQRAVCLCSIEKNSAKDNSVKLAKSSESSPKRVASGGGHDFHLEIISVLNSLQEGRLFIAYQFNYFHIATHSIDVIPKA